MGYSRKNPNSGFEDMEFPGGIKGIACRNSRVWLKNKWSWNFQEVSHNFAEFPAVKACFM